MQESLVQRLPATPGFAVDAAYRPASQVGGDFYRIFPAGEGAILVVVGDVSGKGLKAAMTVSGLVCAMETIETRMPGPFLVKLNHAAKSHLKSGFVTCCAALMKPNGEVRIANAGHLAPYADGCEVNVEAGLPLGIAADVEYPESMAEGDRFTFLSDGVLEAANATHELFGFARSREVSIQPAATIAQTAQTWGQNDDITVVTVRRTA
jgi:serine phosphatase RsbU (regulator of sigma subunit)